MMDVELWRVPTSMRCGHALFGARVLVRGVPAARPLTYLLTYLLVACLTYVCVIHGVILPEFSELMPESK